MAEPSEALARVRREARRVPAWTASGVLFAVAGSVYAFPDEVPAALGVVMLLLWFAYVACLPESAAGPVLLTTMSVVGLSALVGNVEFLPPAVAAFGAVVGCIALYLVHDRRAPDP